MVYRLAEVEEPAFLESTSHEKSSISRSALIPSQGTEWLTTFKTRRRVNPEELEAAILAYCRDEFRSVREMAEALGRGLSTLHTRYLPRLVQDGRLELRYPDQPRHSRQAYWNFDVNLNQGAIRAIGIVLFIPNGSFYLVIFHGLHFFLPKTHEDIGLPAFQCSYWR